MSGGTAADAPAAGLSAAAAVAGSRILGIGAYRPARVVGNAEVAEAIDSSDEWIRRRSGIATRRFASPDETVVQMAAAASVKALAQAGIPPETVDTVLLASMSHLEQSPPAAPRVAHRMGAVSAGAMDVGAACAGFGHALATADSLIRSGNSRHVVVVGSERMTDIVDPLNRGTAFLFGDGAAPWWSVPPPSRASARWSGDRRATATRPSPTPRPGTGGTRRPRCVPLCAWTVRGVPLGGFHGAEDGAGGTGRRGVTTAELAAFIPHQANLRIVDGAASALRLPPHVVVARDVVHAGNTSAASVPLAMEELLARGAVPRGGLALLVGFGAGLSHAAQVVVMP